MSTPARRIALVGAVALAVGCGLSTTGLEPVAGDASVDGAGSDATGSGSHDGSGSSGGDANGGSSSGADGTASSSGSSSGTGGDATTTDTGGKDVVTNDSPGETGTGDVGVPCKGNTKSCGQPGQCVDCTNSAQGSACVGGACGCNDPTKDCPANNACSSGHTCSTSCLGGLTCNGGCCDGTSCVAGGDNAACGSNGNACQPCSGQTPTCAGGTCNGNCGGGADGTCGLGFCCSNGSCAGNTNPQSCGPSGQACVDCSTSPSGPKCGALGACGCTAGSDCPPDNSCGPTFQCTTACAVPGQLCNSGCCSGTTGTCVASCGGGGQSNCKNGSCQ